MKFLNKDDKEFFTIILVILIMIVSFGVCIFATIRTRNTAPQKHYDLDCVTNYLKAPLTECTYKEVE